MMKGPEEIVDRFAKGLRDLLAEVRRHTDEEYWHDILGVACDLLAVVTTAVYARFNIDLQLIKIDVKRGAVEVVKHHTEDQGSVAPIPSLRTGMKGGEGR